MSTIKQIEISLTTTIQYEPIVRNPDGKGGVIFMGDLSAANHTDRFDVIVYCAKEFQPSPELVKAINPLHPMKVIFAPNEDRASDMSNEEVRIAFSAASKVARAFCENKRILVSCAQGRNRSGLVVAIAIHLLYGCGGQEAINIIKQNRRGAKGDVLSNPNFVEFLRELKAVRSKTG